MPGAYGAWPQQARSRRSQSLQSWGLRRWPLGAKSGKYRLLAMYRRPMAGPPQLLRRVVICPSATVGRGGGAFQAMERFAQDLRHAWRSLNRDRRFAGFVVAALGLGIGAVTLAWSVLYAVLWRPLPYEKPGELVMVWQTDPALGLPDRARVIELDLRDYRRETHTLNGLAGFVEGESTIELGGESRTLVTALVTPELFNVLGVRPLLGRALQAGDRAQQGNIVLSERLWAQLYNRNPAVVGKKITLATFGVPSLYTIVGVMPASFEFPYPLLYKRPMAWYVFQLQRDPTRARATHNIYAIGRLRAGATLSGAQVEMESIAQRLTHEFPDSNSGVDARVVPLRSEIAREFQPTLWAFGGSALLVLLIGCANVWHLLLARAELRKHEMAVRVALGARSMDGIRLTASEGMILGFAAGLLGIGFAVWALPQLVHAISHVTTIPRILTATVDSRAIVFCAGLSLVISVFCATAPLAAGKEEPGRVLAMAAERRSANPPRRAAGRLLIGSEACFAFLLIWWAVALTRSVTKLSAVQPGYDPSRLLTFELDLPNGYQAESAYCIPFFHRVLDEIGSLPGVSTVGLVHDFPYTTFLFPFSDESMARSRNGGVQAASITPATRSFFGLMRLSPLRGRLLSSRDTADSPNVGVINHKMADLYWPGMDPVGRKISFPMRSLSEVNIVGVVPNVLNPARHGAVDPIMYVPFDQFPRSGNTIAVRTRMPAHALDAPIQKLITAMDPQASCGPFITANQMIRQHMARPSFVATTAALMAAVAQLLALLGIYAVVSYAIAARRREIAIRMALGARPRDILALTLRQGMIPVILGICAGLGGSVATARLVAAMLYGLSPLSPGTMLSAILLLGITASVACIVPSAKAAQVQPAALMRQR